MDNKENDLGTLEQVIPAMNLSVPTEENNVLSNLVSDDQLLGIYGEIIDNLRQDRKDIDELLANFVEMVINDGDPSAASKEAVVNLVKIKSDTSDKMAKVADLMTRVKLKEQNTFPRYLAANQNNTINIGNGGKATALRTELIKQLDQEKRQKKVKKDAN